jgi:hypothetical protein
MHDGWDMMIAFPPCTDLALVARCILRKKIANGNQAKYSVFMDLVNAQLNKIENPIGIGGRYRKPNQIIQPWQFGDKAAKVLVYGLKRLL